MGALYAFTLILLPALQGMRIGVGRCWISGRRMADERSKDAEFGRVLGVGENQDAKRSPFAQS